MDAYQVSNGRRAIKSEIARYIADKLGVTIVGGFSSVLHEGDAVVGRSRVAGFMETSDRREWLLPLSARKALVWESAAAPERVLKKAAFLLSVGFGNGSPLPQPTGQWDIYVDDRLAISIRVVTHSKVWRQGDCVFAFAANRIESAAPNSSITLSSIIENESFAAFGPGLLIVPAAWVKPGKASRLRVEARCAVESTRWFQVATSPNMLDSADLYGMIDQVESPGARIEGRRVYFGDIHTHSGQVCEELENNGCGRDSREDNYRYAMGPGGLDFYALTDHEWQVDPQKVPAYFELAQKYNRDGEFACIPAYEFTSLIYGHRNIYFKGPGGIMINSSKPWGRPTKDPALSTTPAELWNALEESGREFISIPHHPSAASHPFYWDSYDARYDRLVEVYSSWGSSEYYGDFPRGISDRYRSLTVRDALERGCRVGLIASADGHDGHPGNAQSPLVKHHHIFHPNGSGLAAVFVDELTPAAVYEALKNRSCYATTGVPINLWFAVEDNMMGSELPALGQGSRPNCRLPAQDRTASTTSGS